MEISSNMVWVVIAIVVVAAIAIVFKGQLSAAYGKLRIKASGGETTSRDITVAERLKASDAHLGDIIGSTSEIDKPGVTRVANNADLSGSTLGSIIGHGAPSERSTEPVAPPSRAPGTQAQSARPQKSAHTQKP